jgi:uncharacterized protein YciI
MLYTIVATDVENSLSNRLRVRPAHLNRLKQLQKENRLLIAGPHPYINSQGTTGFSGSLIIAEFTSQEEAEAWARADPYVAVGVYASVTIKPFKKVLPE